MPISYAASDHKPAALGQQTAQPWPGTRATGCPAPASAARQASPCLRPSTRYARVACTLSTSRLRRSPRRRRRRLSSGSRANQVRNPRMPRCPWRDQSGSRARVVRRAATRSSSVSTCRHVSADFREVVARVGGRSRVLSPREPPDDAERARGGRLRGQPRSRGWLPRAGHGSRAFADVLRDRVASSSGDYPPLLTRRDRS